MIERQSSRYGRSIAIELLLDGSTLGELTDGRALAVTVPPGTHLIEGRTSKRFGDPLSTMRKLIVVDASHMIRAGMADGAIFLEGTGIEDADKRLIDQYPRPKESQFDKTPSAGRTSGILTSVGFAALLILYFSFKNSDESSESRRNSRYDSDEYSESRSRPAPHSEAVKTRCAFEADESAYAFVANGSVDTRRWLSAAPPAARIRYIRCLNLSR